MSRLSKFMATPKVVEIKGESFKVYPLKSKDMIEFSGDPNKLSKEDQFKMTVKMVKKSLRDEPDVTDEEIANLDADILLILQDAILEASGLTEQNDALARIRKIKEQNTGK